MTVETVQLDTTANVDQPRYAKERSREGRNRGDTSASLSEPYDFVQGLFSDRAVK